MKLDRLVRGGFASGWVVRSAVDSSHDLAVGLVSVAYGAYDRTKRLVAIEREHLEDLVAEGKARYEAKRARSRAHRRRSLRAPRVADVPRAPRGARGVSAIGRSSRERRRSPAKSSSWCTTTPGACASGPRSLRDDARARRARLAARSTGCPGSPRVTHNAAHRERPRRVRARATSSRTRSSSGSPRRRGSSSPFDPRAAKPRSRPAGALIDGARELNAIANELTGGRRRPARRSSPRRSPGVAAYSFAFGKGTRLPRWDNLLWWSYSIFTVAPRARRSTGRGRRDAARGRWPRVPIP